MSAIDEPSGMHRPSMIEIVAVEPDADGGVETDYDPIKDIICKSCLPADPTRPRCEIGGDAFIILA